MSPIENAAACSTVATIRNCTYIQQKLALVKLTTLVAVVALPSVVIGTAVFVVDRANSTCRLEIAVFASDDENETPMTCAKGEVPERLNPGPTRLNAPKAVLKESGKIPPPAACTLNPLVLGSEVNPFMPMYSEALLPLLPLTYVDSEPSTIDRELVTPQSDVPTKALKLPPAT